MIHILINGKVREHAIKRGLHLGSLSKFVAIKEDVKKIDGAWDISSRYAEPPRLKTYEQLNKFEQSQVDAVIGDDPVGNYLYWVGRLKGSKTHAVSIEPKDDVITSPQINYKSYSVISRNKTLLENLKNYKLSYKLIIKHKN